MTLPNRVHKSISHTQSYTPKFTVLLHCQGRGRGTCLSGCFSEVRLVSFPVCVRSFAAVCLGSRSDSRSRHVGCCPVCFHSNPNQAHLIQHLEQGCPTLFLEVYCPVCFHSNPNQAHIIQHLEQVCPTLFLEIYCPVGFHSNPNQAHITTSRAGLPNPVPGGLLSCRFSLQP